MVQGASLEAEEAKNKLQILEEKDFIHFTPIPMTYTELLPNLISNDLVVVGHVKPLQPPYPKGYDANVKCGYHGGAVGHST